MSILTRHTSRIILDETLGDEYVELNRRYEYTHQVLGSLTEDIPGHQGFLLSLRITAATGLTVTALLATLNAQPMTVGKVVALTISLVMTAWIAHAVLLPGIINQWSKMKRQSAVDTLDDLDRDMERFLAKLSNVVGRHSYGDLAVGTEAAMEMVFQRDRHRKKDANWKEQHNQRRLEDFGANPLDTLYVVTRGGLERRAALVNLPGHGVFLTIE